MCTTSACRNAPSFGRRLNFAGFIPDWPVDLLVKWRTASGKLAQFVVLGAHQGRAITERAAHALAVEPALLLNLLSKIRLRQCRSAYADESNLAVAEIGRSRMEHELLQVTVAAADHG